MDNGKKPLSTERTAVYKRNKRRVLRYLKAFPPGTPGPIPKLYLESPVQHSTQAKK
ncbi:GSCOCG00004378001-RA-CDS [Cotesia congregata]|nr:GSCOCG00004378001-RA-CDS [Cotesia congregata]